MSFRSYLARSAAVMVLALSACGTSTDVVGIHDAGIGSLPPATPITDSTPSTAYDGSDEVPTIPTLPIEEDASVLIFVDGEFVEAGSGNGSKGKVPLGVAEAGPPVRVGDSTLVQLGTWGDPMDLWRVDPTGISERIASHVSGMVASTGGTSAYAQHPSTFPL